jgi:regulator of RNase E activity RraA
MAVRPGDLIHADRHGAVVVPHAVAAQVPDAAALVARKEKVVIEASRRPGFSVAELRKAFADQDDVH